MVLVSCALLFALCDSVRVGYLSAIDQRTETRRIDSIRQALREIGYIEGQNIRPEYRYADGNMERMTLLAKEFVRLKVDVLVPR